MATGYGGLVIGRSNRLAITAARRFASNLGVVAPLLLVGPPGTGKSQLLWTLADDIRVRRGCRVVVMDARNYADKLVDAIPRNRTRELWDSMTVGVGAIFIDALDELEARPAAFECLSRVVLAHLSSGHPVAMTCCRARVERWVRQKLTTTNQVTLRAPDAAERRRIIGHLIDARRETLAEAACRSLVARARNFPELRGALDSALLGRAVGSTG